MSKPFRIVHFSDLHEMLPMRTPSGFFDKRLIGFLNSKLFRGKKHHSRFVGQAVERILTDSPDVIAFTGDATTCGQPSEFERTLDLLRPLISSGIPLLYVPGNHDAYVKNKICAAAYRSFVERVTGGICSLESYPLAYETGPCRFLLFNASRPTNPVLSCGFFTKKSRDFLRMECEKKEKTLISLCHYPFERDDFFLQRFRRGLYGIRKVRGELKQLDLALCGHVHKPFHHLDDSGRGESDSGSLTRYGIYSVFDFDGRVFHHSTRSLTCEGEL